MLTGRVYQEHVFGVPAAAIVNRLLDWIELVFTQLNPLGIFLGVLGGAALSKREVHFLVASFASIAVLSVYSITYNTIDSEVLTIPTFMVFSTWVGIGFFWIVSGLSIWAKEVQDTARVRVLRFVVSRPVLVLSAIAFGAVPITAVMLNYSSRDLSSDRQAYEYAREVMDSVPDGSVVMSDGEDTAFSMWYMRYVEDTQRDVAPIAVRLLQFDWYWRNIHARYPDRFPADGPTDLGQALRRIVEDNEGDSRVFFTFWNPSLIQFDLKSTGKLYEATVKAVP